jgi:hypothetical protein
MAAVRAVRVGTASLLTSAARLSGCIRLVCSATGEQPARVGVGGGVHVAPLADPGEQEPREWCRDR